MMQGIGPACPLHIDAANNDLTGRLIVSNQVKELIVQLHNEVKAVSQDYLCKAESSTTHCLS